MLTFMVLLLYTTAVVGLAIYGAWGVITLVLYWRHRQGTRPWPGWSNQPQNVPNVTIQLPIFNEKLVVQQLLDAAVQVVYPRTCLEIQVLDDSTDETTAVAEQLAAEYRAQGVNISVRHRLERTGYKAGALAEGTAVAQGEFLAIFDADFLPQPDFLQKTIPYFLQNPQLGMVQTRWGHSNAQQSPLTGAQAIIMDKHFLIEQTVSHRADLYPKFNGTAGVWRRQCIEAVGGWQADTVCEDLCLSTRAVLGGWECHFLPEVVTPGELPASMAAYKSQQARWAKGSWQCLRKFGGQIWRDKQHPLGARLYALVGMSGYLAHPLILLSLLLQIPLLWLGAMPAPWLMGLTLLNLSHPALFVLGQQLAYPDWGRRLRYLPAMMMVTLGLAPTVTRAIVQVFTRGEHPFVRTPKQGIAKHAAHAHSYRLPWDWIVLVEMGLAGYTAVGILLALRLQQTGSLFFLGLACLGFVWVAAQSWREGRG
jgi:cellulose synthase/poly-beta-1,6-N-acetylglucosamine synthase-like glycosyltransferase